MSGQGSIEVDRLLIFVHGFLVIPGDGVDLSKAPVRIRKGWIELYGRLRNLNRLVITPREQQRLGLIRLQRDPQRIELLRALVLRERFGIPAKYDQEQSIDVVS